MELVEGFLVLLEHLGFDVSDYGPKREPEWTLHLWDTLHYRVLSYEHMIDHLREVLPDTQAFKVVVRCLSRVPRKDLPEIAFWMLNPFHTSLTLDWIESHIDEVVSPWHWSWLSTLSGFSWSRAESWLNCGRPLSLVALDALANMDGASESPIVQRANPKLVNPVPFDQAARVLSDYLAKDRVPRVERVVESILKRWSLITDGNTGVGREGKKK